jgi:hypothetical protein
MAEWIIRGYDSTTKLFELTAPGNLVESEIITILTRLSSRDLTPEEVIDSSKRSNHRGAKRLLEPHIDCFGEVYSISVGTNPYYVASKHRS